MLYRLRMWAVGVLLRPEAEQYVEAKEDPQPPKKHFDWVVPENARVTGFDAIRHWNVNDPDLAE